MHVHPPAAGRGGLDCAALPALRLYPALQPLQGVRRAASLPGPAGVPVGGWILLGILGGGLLGAAVGSALHAVGAGFESEEATEIAAGLLGAFAGMFVSAIVGARRAALYYLFGYLADAVLANGVDPHRLSDRCERHPAKKRLQSALRRLPRR